MAQTIGTSNKVDVWADDGTVVEPASSKVDVGWQLGEQPPHEFMNWLQNTFGLKLNHILQHGVPRWNNATEYGVGDFVTHNDQLYRAVNTNTNSEPPSGNWQSYQIQTSPTDTTPGRLPALFDIGGGVGQISLESLPVATQEQTDEPEGVEALIRADRQWEAPGWKYISTSEVTSAVSSVDISVPEEFDHYNIIAYGVTLDTDGGNLRVRYRVDGSGSFESGSVYNVQLLRLQGNTSIDIVSSDSSNDFFVLNGLPGPDGATSALSAHGDLFFSRLSGAMRWDFGTSRGSASSSNRESRRGYGRMGSISSVDDIRFFSSSANIASGVFQLFGMRG